MFKFLAGGIGQLLAVGSLSAIVSGFVVGPVAYNQGYASHAKEYRHERAMFFSREITLWQYYGAAHKTQEFLISQIRAALDVTGEARAKMRAEISKYETRAANSAEIASIAIRRLDYVESNWPEQPLPDELILPFCVPDGPTPCAPCSPAAESGDDMEVCRAATGNGVDP